VRVDWVKPTKKLQWLGLVTGDRTAAKLTLFAWGKTVSNPPIPGYGTATDFTGPWSDRDQAMLDAFVDYWNGLHPNEKIFKQSKADSPSKGESDALAKWAASAPQQITPGQFPSSHPPQTFPIPTNFPLLILVPTGWPQGVDYPPPKPAYWPDGLAYPPIGDFGSVPTWWTTAQQSGASLPNWPPPKPDNWPNTFPWPVPPTTVTTMLSCEQICEAQFGPKGTNQDFHGLNVCKMLCHPLPPPPGGGTPSQPLVPGQFRPLPEPGAPATTTAPKTNVLPLLIAGAAVIGLGWFFLRRGALGMLQENPEFSALGWTFSAHKTGKGKIKTPKLKLSKGGREDFSREWKRVFPTLPVPDIEQRALTENVSDDSVAVVYLAREYLNRQGYTSRGQYFGVGEPLYVYEAGDTRGGFIKHGHVRARTRAEAKMKVREKLYGYDVRFTR
jgi:hypothetical protein